MVAYIHLPGLFEFHEFYKEFLPLYINNPEYFYDYCKIGSLYGAPEDCIWGGGRVGYGNESPENVLSLANTYGISARLTFSNSLLKKEHLGDKRCNDLCALFNESAEVKNGVIIHSDLLLNYLKEKYTNLYFVSSTTKVQTDFNEFIRELNKDDFKYVVPDFRLNKQLDKLSALTEVEKNKVEFLCNECCYFGCMDRKECYEAVSKINLGKSDTEYICRAPESNKGYRFSSAMKNPGFISLYDIENIYIPMGFNNFKIEGRGLGSALLLEFILYYMTKPEYRLIVREELYLDNMLDLF